VGLRAEEPEISLESLQSLIDERRYDEARTVGLELLTEAKGDAARAAAILDKLVSAARRAGDSAKPETQEMAVRAIALNQDAFGPEHPAVATSISRYALVLAAAGDLKGALEQHERALSIRERVLPVDHLDIAKSLNSLGNVLRRLGNYNQAAPLFERALAIREAAHGPIHKDVAEILQNMGNNHLRAGNYTAAADDYARALAIKEELLGPDHTSLAYTLISMGVLYRETGDYEASRSAYERALQITIASLGPEHPLTLAANNNLANLFNETGDYESAIPLYERTLAAREKKLGPDHPHVAETRHNLAIASMRIGDYETAAAQLEQSLEIWEKTLGPDHPDVASSLESLANLEMLRGGVLAAVPLYERALGIRISRLGPDHPQTADSHLVLGAAFLEQDRRGEALDQALRAVDIQDRHLRETVAYMHERQALAMVGARGKPESLLFLGLTTADSDRQAWADACWAWTLRHRGLVQEELAGRNRSILDRDTPEARQAWSALADRRMELGAIWVEGPGEDADAFQVSLERARLRKEEAEVELARMSHEFRQQRSLDSLTPARVRELLPDSSVLVEIVRVELAPPTQLEKPTVDVALIMRPDDVLDFVVLGSSGETDQRVGDWRDALVALRNDAAALWAVPDALSGIEETGTRLRETVWDPIEERIGNASVVFFVPDGALLLIDLVALPSTNGDFLLESGPAIHLLDAARDLVRFDAPLATRETARGGILALGDADFDDYQRLELATMPAGQESAVYRSLDSSCLALAETHWPSLPESGREVQDIRAMFEATQDVLTLTGREASEEQFKQYAPGRRWLHLATHGFFLPDGCEADSPSENPLLLSGLVFAGANRASRSAADSPYDDGILTAEELTALDLRSVELAVLSACDTGRGTVVTGEGVLGLRRAFRIAGTSTVVMSLWPVPDATARAWMAHFYAELAAGVPLGDAVRNAGLNRLAGLREEGRPLHPHQWAGFVAVGDWH